MIQLGRVSLAEGDVQVALQLQRDAVERLASLLPPDTPELTEAHFEYGRSLLADGNTLDGSMQFKAARNALASRFGDASWRVAKADFLLASALEMQGRQEDATALRTESLSRMEAQLAESHPLRQQLREGRIL
jgi:hypothetical protein